MNATSIRIRFAAATAAMVITFALLHSVCAIADHSAAIQIAAAKIAHPTVVAFGR